MNWLILLLRLIASGILLQTLFFKFSAAPESVYIFSTLNAEPGGRLLSGVVEAIASVLLLIPITQGLGGLLGIAVMSGAILSHLFILGIEIQGDGGLLFCLAVTVFLACTAIVYFDRKHLIQWLPMRFQSYFSK